MIKGWRGVADASGHSVRVCCVIMWLAVVSVAQSLITSVQVGSYPVAVAVNTRTNKIYVANKNSNSVTVIDGLTNHATSIATGLAPSALAVNPLTNQIYAVNANSNNVTVIDGATNHTATVATGAYPLAIDVNTVTNRVYVSNYNSNTVTVIDGASNAVTTIPVGLRPWPIAVDSTTNTIYVGNQSGNSVSVIDGATGAVQTVAVGTRPRAIAVNLVTHQIYVANYQSASVSAIDGSNLTANSVNVGLYPLALAVDAVRNRVYVANSGDDSATVIDGATLSTRNIAIGNSPSGVDVDPVTDKAYFADLDYYGTVTMVNGTDYSTTSVDVGAGPGAIAVNSVSNRIYTANELQNSVSVVGGGSSDPLQFKTLTPCRLVDTRLPAGPFGGPAIGGGTSRNFSLPQANCGVPANAAAYSLNVTVVPTGALSYLTVWPTGESQPVVSTLNSLDGRIKANAAIMPAGAAGSISVYASNTTHVVLDINGYFTAPGTQTLEYYPLTPCRVLDTRHQQGRLGGPYLRGTRERDFPMLSSTCQIPSSAQAYSMNFTVVPWQGKPLGYLSVWPAGGTQPLVSTLNNLTAGIVANAAIVPAGIDGGVAVFPDQDTDLVADINGYFAPAGDGGLSLYPTAPCRVIDTRLSGGPFSGQRNPDINVPATPCGIPSTAGGYVFNATVVPVGGLGYLTLWPDGSPQPLVSTLNALDGIIASNMAVVPNQTGQIDAYASGVTQLVLDISSYFAP